MDLQDLLKLAYEAEGLIALLINRSGEATAAPNDIQKLLIDKVDELHKATYEMMFTINDAHTSAWQAHTVVDDTPAPEHEQDPDPEQTDVAPEAPEAPETSEIPEVSEESVEEEEMVEDDGIETVEVYDLEDEPVDDEESTPADEPSTRVDIDFDSDPDTPFRVDIEDETPADNIDDYRRDNSDVVSETYDLNSRVFSQKNADDFQKMISLNDWHRFFRELFGKSSIKFNEAIDMIRTMNSYDEAEEYFYEVLEWPADDDNVKDFMTLVKLYLARK